MPSDELVSGKYKHFKDKPYLVYCVAYDEGGQKYILYQQSYDDKDFWIRPYEMFFEEVLLDGQKVQRFNRNSSNTRNYSEEKYINKLVELISKDNPIYIKHSETESLYKISSINTEDGIVEVSPISFHRCSGYLSDTQIAERMGYYLSMVDGKAVLSKSEIYDEPYKLSIDDYEEKDIIKTLALVQSI